MTMIIELKPRKNVFVPVCQYVLVVSRFTWPRDVNEDLFGPFYQEATLVSNKREGTEAMTRDVAEGGEVVIRGIQHDNATCLSGAV